MRQNDATSNGRMTTTIHAPSANLETATTTAVTPVATAPTRLIGSERRACLPPSRRQCATIPACDIVNASERADREERNEPIGDAAERDEQRAREHGEDDDALRVHEAPAANRERIGEEAVLGEHAAEARKVGEARVRREREHRHHRSDGDVVEGAAPHDRADEHREHALVAGLSRIGRGDAVRAREVGDAGEQEPRGSR